MAGPKQTAKTAGTAFLGPEVQAAGPEKAYFHVLPVPWAGERGRNGAMHEAPELILQASENLAEWDGRGEPQRSGIYTHPVLDCEGSAEQMLERLAASVSAIVTNGGFPFALGGDGALSFGMARGLLEAGSGDFGVIQIDARADLLDEDNGDPYSELCVMKRILDEDIPLFQLGVRMLSKAEADARKVYGVRYYDADFLVARNINKVELPGDFPEQFYLSINIDGFDPSVFPSPSAVPGGLGWWQVLGLVESIAQQGTIIGMDLSEYSPAHGQPCHERAAASLAYKLMGIVERTR